MTAYATCPLMRGRTGGELPADSGRARLFSGANGVPVRPMYTVHHHWERTLKRLAARADGSLEVDIAGSVAPCARRPVRAIGLVWYTDCAPHRTHFERVP